MVHFCNGTNASTYVSLATPTSEQNGLDKPKKKNSIYDKFVSKTTCRAELLVVKIIVFVLILVAIWLVDASYNQQKQINSMQLSRLTGKSARIQREEKVEYECDLSIGRGISTSKIDINYLKGNACVNACSYMKRKDYTVNGVIIFSDNKRKGCWCTRNMTSIIGKYKTCFLKPNTSKINGGQNSSHSKSIITTPSTPQYNRCHFSLGDGVGGSEFKMANLKGDACVDTCLHLREIDHTINGVTTYSNTSKVGCWCRKGMNGIRRSRLFQTCQLPQTNRKANPGTSDTYVCDFTFGNGAGGSDIKVGYQKGRSCIDACIHMKKLDPSINGVTMYNNPSHLGCWCEKNMNIVDGTFKACFLNRKWY